MKFLLIVSVIVGGIALAMTAAAHDSFDTDDEGASAGSPAAVVSPAAASLSASPDTSAGLRAQAAQLPFGLLAVDFDGDQDGLSDSDEVRLGTKSTAADTDGDSYLDALEVVRGYNPLIASPGDKIDFSVIRVDASASSAELLVTGVRLERAARQDVLVITGTGPAQTVLTLFVYSSHPHIVVVRIDDTGRFRAVLADTLESGEHRVYAALSDVAGQPTQVSEAVAFMRTAEGIVVSFPAPPAGEAPPGDSIGWTRYYSGVVGGVVAILLLASILIYVRHRWRLVSARKQGS